MENPEEIKNAVREKYSQLAVLNQSCGCGCCGTETDITNISDDYSKVEGYVPDADLGLGCGLPTEYAAIKPGDTVLDLGSGAGNDVFIAHNLVGEDGRVIGIDFSDEMIAKAQANRRKLGFENVGFRKGDIENMPVESGSVDVVISNCVLNLVPDKSKAFSEIYRVLKTGGHFCVSDVVIKGELPEKMKKAVGLYTGCIAGALPMERYLGIIDRTGFTGVTIAKEKEIELPDEALLGVLSEDELKAFRQSGVEIVSITVRADK